MILYHGSREIVKYPEIRKAQYHKDFYFGFYCTKLPNQANAMIGVIASLSPNAKNKTNCCTL